MFRLRIDCSWYLPEREVAPAASFRLWSHPCIDRWASIWQARVPRPGEGLVLPIIWLPIMPIRILEMPPHAISCRSASVGILVQGGIAVSYFAS